MARFSTDGKITGACPKIMEKTNPKKNACNGAS